jgi:hypothetical protein
MVIHLRTEFGDYLLLRFDFQKAKLLPRLTNSVVDGISRGKLTGMDITRPPTRINGIIVAWKTMYPRPRDEIE